MSIQFACPICKTTYTVRDEDAGKKSECKKCGQRLQVPDPPRPARAKTILGDVVDQPPSNPQQFSSPDPGGGFELQSTPTQSTTNSPASETSACTCPGCGRVIPLTADDLNVMILCKRCGTQFDPSTGSVDPGVQPVAGQDSSSLPTGWAREDWSVGRFLGRGRKHSGLGMAAFLIAVLVGGLNVILGLITVLNIAGSKGDEGVKDSVIGGAMAMTCLNCLSIPLCLVGVGLAGMALVAHKDRNHTMTYIGLGVNALVILGVLALYLIASVSRH